MTASWAEFQQKRDQAKPDPDKPQLHELCARVFSSADGKALLEYLHERYVNEVLPGIPEERALLSNNAKRQFVRMLENETAAGLLALSKGKTAA